MLIGRHWLVGLVLVTALCVCRLGAAEPISQRMDIRWRDCCTFSIEVSPVEDGKINVARQAALDLAKVAARAYGPLRKRKSVIVDAGEIVKYEDSTYGGSLPIQIIDEALKSLNGRKTLRMSFRVPAQQEPADIATQSYPP